MNYKQTTSQWFYNTSFTTSGNYTWVVGAIDTSRNINQSIPALFSLAPNWDVTHDGSCTLNDMDLISESYGETGSNGWIREDVDNNGCIQVLDFVLSAQHYQESWMG